MQSSPVSFILTKIFLFFVVVSIRAATDHTSSGKVVGSYYPTKPVGCDSVEKYLANKFDTNPIENIYLRPSSTAAATAVQVAIDVKNILWINSTDSQWQMMVDFYRFWNDPRLAYSIESCSALQKFSLPDANHIWIPDLFFPLLYNGYTHSVPQSNFLLWVKPNGDVTYSVRLTLTMECTGEGNTAVKTVCPLIISSYKSPKNKVDIHWVDQDPVIINWDRLTLKGYQLNVTTTETEHTTRLATYAYAVANFTFLKDSASPS